MQVFFYKAWIMRDGERVEREGTIQAKFPMEALDKLSGYAVNEWKRPLLKVELYEINEGGALVATSTVSERIDAVLTTHKALGTGKVKHIVEARKKREEASHSVKPVPQLPAPSKAKTPMTEWGWMSQVGSYESMPNFATLKITEGAFK